MTVEDYKKQMRINRGRLARCDDELSDIFNHGSTLFNDWMLNNKTIGIGKGAFCAMYLTHEQQDELVQYARSTNCSKKLIDLKISELELRN